MGADHGEDIKLSDRSSGEALLWVPLGTGGNSPLL